MYGTDRGDHNVEAVGYWIAVLQSKMQNSKPNLKPKVSIWLYKNEYFTMILWTS